MHRLSTQTCINMAGVHVHPPAVELQDLQPGTSHSVPITIKNQSTHTRTIRVRPPKSPYFSIHGFPQAQKLPPGLEVTFQVLVHGEQLTDIKQLLSDKVVIQTEVGEYELQLKVLTPRADVHIEGDLMYGLIPVDSKASKTFKIINNGTAAADFKLDWDRASGMMLTPASGQLAALNSGSGQHEVEITASLLVQDPGGVAGEVTVLVGQGATEGRKIGFSATVVKQNFELMDVNNTRVTEMDFNTLFFGDGSSRTVTIFNNGPLPAKFRISYGNAAEMKGKLSDDQGGGDDPDDPYADLIAATHQTIRSKATNDNPFNLSPLAGSIAPYSKTSVQVSFNPKDVPNRKGFQATLPGSDATTRIFDFLALVEFSGCPASSRLTCPLRGKGQAAALVAEPPAVPFGDLACYDWGDQLVTLRNTSETLGLRFAVSTKQPYFQMQPPSGNILPGQTYQVMLRYCPQALGTHQGNVTLKVMSENSNNVVQELKIQVAGTSLRAGQKGQLVGGADKAPNDFVKPSQYVSPDQLVQSVMVAHKPSSKGTKPFWDQPDLQQAFADIGLTGTEHAYSKEELVTVKQHKQKYISAMREGLAERQRKARNAHVDDSDVNLGMDTHSGLKPMEPKLPNQPDALWTLSSLDGAQPKQQRTVTASQLAGIPVHKDRPNTEAEQQACSKELEKAQISKLVIGPKVVDFGAVSVGSTAVQHLLMVNTLDQPIHVVLDLKAVPELRGSKNSAQVIPPGQRAMFPLTLIASDIKNISEKVDYCINGHHCLSFSVSARVVPVTVDLSCEEVQFEYSLDDWEHHLERLVQVSNPHKFPVEFSLACSAPQAFTCSPMEGVIKPQSALDLLIRWTLPHELSSPPPPPKKSNQKKQGDAKPAEPPAGGPQLSGVQEATVVINLLGGDQPRRIALQGQLPEVGLKFKDKVLEGGHVPLFTPQTVTAQLKNTGTHAAAFKVLPNPLLQVTPEKQRVAPDETVELQVTFNLPQAGPFQTVLEVQVQGGHTLKLPVKSEGVLPLVEVTQPSFDFGPVYMGSFAKLPFTLVNTTPVPAKLMVDMLRIPDLQLTIAKEAWSPAEYEECPLQRIGAYGELVAVGSQRGSTSGSGRSTRRSSSINAMGFTGATGYKFTVSMNPSSTLDLQLVYKAESAGPQQWDLNLASLTSNSVAPMIRSVSADGVQPRIIISRTSVDFGVQTVIRSNQVKPPYVQGIYFTNREDQPVEVRLGPFSGQDAGVFGLDITQLTLQPGEMTPVSFQFIPRDGKSYESMLPVYLNDDSDPYIQIEVVGQGQHPRLTFDVRECVLPVVPLGVKSRATFHVVNVNYDNLELRYRLPADETHQPLSLEFPEGNLIGVARERLPVTVTFESSRPVSFTANIDFMDEDGKRYSIPVSAAADNCLISHQPFIQANEGLAVEVPDAESPVVLRTDSGALFNLPSQSSALGPTSPIYSIVRYLNAASGRGPYDAQLHSQLVGSRGKLVTELIELLSGKSLPGKVPKLSSNRKEAAEQLLGAFDAALTFLRAHGALLNSVKPEMLLDVDDFNRVLTARMTRAEDDPDACEALALWDDVRESFELYSVQAWNAVMSQMFKVFVLGRITLKVFRSLPGMSEPSGAAQAGSASEPSSPQPGHAKALIPAAYQLRDTAILGSNLYSASEGCLLAWATAHFGREFGSRAIRLTNFDEDFRDGLALFSLLSGYWPAFSAKKSSMRSGAALTPAECSDNADLVVRLMSELGLPYEINAKDICEPDAREMLVLLVYLFQVLPQFVPKSTIDFNCRLGETQVKELELSNPSRKGIAYTVRLEGHPDFSIDATVARIDAQGTTRLPCKCTPTTSLAQTARLVLMSKRDGGAYAATMVFLLRAVINTRAPLKRVRTEGPLYEMQQFEFTLTNPFKTDCDFSLSLLHEPAEPLPVATDDKKGKKKPAAKSSNGKPSNSGNGQQPAASTLYPNAFGLDRSRLRLKANGSEKIRASFLPFYMGTHYCTVVIKDKEQGEFTYELVGETLLPPPCMEFKGVIPLEGPNHTFDLCIPLPSSQLETAKRTFLEKHPLAKDRAQAALLKTDPFKGLTESTYTLSQTNSLITCPDTLVLNANAIPPVPITKGGPPPAKKDDLVPPGILRVALKPVGVGIYPTRLLLTNTAGLDTRVVDLELTAQVMTQQFDLIFDCAARQSIAQDIPLVNASDQYMVVQAELSGPSKAFSGGKELTVPPSNTASYHLSFKPLTPGDHTATLELSIPSTGERNTYRLIGRATEPVAESHIVLECQARTPVTKTIAVPNIVGGSVEYQVLSSLSCVAGPATIKVTGSQATSYKLTAAPVRSGTYVGSLTFKTSDGQYVWFSVEVRASEPPEVGVIDVDAQVRTAVSIQLTATNPTQDPITLDVKYSHPDCLLGPATVSLPPGSQGPVQLEFYYAPLIPGTQQGSISLVSKELGEFWYQLRMTALPAPPSQLPALTARLGSSASTKIRVANPLDRPTCVAASLAAPAPCFSLVPAVLQLGPESEGFVELVYTPVGLGKEESARVLLESNDIGNSEYHVQGHAEVPDSMPNTTLYGKPGVACWTALSWHNPFPAGVTASLSVHGADDGQVVLVKQSASARASTSGKVQASKESSSASFGSTSFERHVAASGTLQIPIEYHTRVGQPATAELHVSVQQPAEGSAAGEPGQALVWRYPLLLVPEDVLDHVGVTSTFAFKCKVQESVEEVMEVVLKGLGSVPQDGECFTHEVIIPPQHVVNLGPSAFSITQHDTNRITSPEQPLAYLVRFTPQVALDASVTLVVSKPSGGRWRFAVELKADTQESQGVIALEAAMDTTSRAGVPLFSSTNEPQPFTAWLSSDTPLSFDIQPAKGMLPVRPEQSGTAEDTASASHQRSRRSTSPRRLQPTSSAAPSQPSHLLVSYTCRAFNKVVKGTLYVQTPDGLHTFELQGKMPTYVPPTPSDFASSVDNRLQPEVQQRLRVAADTSKATRPNYLVSNIRRTGKRNL